MQTCRRALATLSMPYSLYSSPPRCCSPAASSSSESSKALPDAATLLKESSETTRNLQSVHLQLTVTGEIPELPIESLSGDLTNTPAVAAQGKANILFLGQRLEGVDFVVADGILYGAITSGANFQDFGPAADIYDVSAILNPDTGLANVLANFSDPKTDGGKPSAAWRPSGSPAMSAPTRSTRSPRRSGPPVRFRARRGSARTAATNWCRPDWSPAPATASR